MDRKIAGIIALVSGFLAADRKAHIISRLFRGWKAAPWEELQRYQVTLDVLTVREIVQWADSCRADRGENDRLLLVKASGRWVKRLGYQRPPQIDAQKNVIAFMENAVTGAISHVRLYSFGGMAPKVREMFGDKEAVNLK